MDCCSQKRKGKAQLAKPGPGKEKQSAHTLFPFLRKAAVLQNHLHTFGLFCGRELSSEPSSQGCHKAEGTCPTHWLSPSRRCIPLMFAPSSQAQSHGSWQSSRCFCGPFRAQQALGSRFWHGKLQSIEPHNHSLPLCPPPALPSATHAHPPAWQPLLLGEDSTISPNSRFCFVFFFFHEESPSKESLGQAPSRSYNRALTWRGRRRTAS